MKWQKKKRKNVGKGRYTKDHMTDFKACDGDCDKCELSYDYVTGYNDGYTDGYADAY